MALLCGSLLMLCILYGLFFEHVFVGIQQVNNWLFILFIVILLTIYSFNILILTIDRYIYICHEDMYKKIFSKRLTITYLLATWLVGLASDAPNFLSIFYTLYIRKLCSLEIPFLFSKLQLFHLRYYSELYLFRNIQKNLVLFHFF